MTRLVLHYVHEFKDRHGKVRRYFRRPGFKRVPLPGLPGSEEFMTAAVLGLGYIPSVVHDTAELSPDLIIIPEQLSYVTYSFLHGDIFHLLGNMLFLWVFGDNVEDALGHVRARVFSRARRRRDSARPLPRGRRR